MIKIVFSSMMESQEMNHIEYKIFNSIQVQFQLYHLFYKSKKSFQFYHRKDPANKQTEDHYTNLQAKVADAVSIQYIVKVLTTSGIKYICTSI